ncbi:hypothetical protein MRX96_033243 [Rhipicephalus microplus]
MKQQLKKTPRIGRRAIPDDPVSWCDDLKLETTETRKESKVYVADKGSPLIGRPPSIKTTLVAAKEAEPSSNVPTPKVGQTGRLRHPRLPSRVGLTSCLDEFGKGEALLPTI